MRSFLLFLFFSVNLFCQKLDSSDFLILEGENPNYYYVLTNEGYYISENSDNFIFKNYSESLPKSLNVDVNTLLPVTHKSKKPLGTFKLIFRSYQWISYAKLFPNKAFEI